MGAQLLLLRSAHNSLCCARCVPGTWPDSDRCWLSIRTVDGNTAVGGLGWGQFITCACGLCACWSLSCREARDTPGRGDAVYAADVPGRCPYLIWSCIFCV